MMKKIFSYILISVLTVSMAYFAADAWDYTMSDSQLISYLEKDPTNKKLIKIAKSRKLYTDAYADPYGIETKRLLDEAARLGY